MNGGRYTLIKNARLVDTGQGTVRNCSLLFENAGADGTPSRILEIGNVRVSEAIVKNLTVYNARSHYVSAGFVDLSTHACEPGNMHKETLKSASLAARAGGYTAYLTTADTSPAADDPLVVEYVKANGALTKCRALPGALLTKQGSCGELSPLKELAESGAAAFFADMQSDSSVLVKGMKLCRDNGYPLIIKCSDGARAGIDQDINTARALLLAAECDCPVHLSCVSRARSLELVRYAKSQGVKVTCDTCPQYFVFTQEDIPWYGSSLCLNPPLGSREDKQAILDGIADGTIDCISSDHTPCSQQEKKGKISECAGGMISLQSTFGAAYTYLVSSGIVGLSRLVEMLTEAPARVLGMKDHALKEGSVADITVFGAPSEQIFTKEMNMSRSENSPFFGQIFSGAVIQTFVDGK